MVGLQWTRRTGLCLFSTLVLLLMLSWQASGQELTKHPTLIQLNEASNRIRVSVGLKPCELDERLCKACYNHANYMAQTGSFSHYDNGGYVGRAVAQGFPASVQENIAAGQGSVQYVMDTWQASGGHYAAIVGSYNKVGFGLAYSSGGCPYWVALYGYDGPVVQNNYVPNYSGGRRGRRR